MIKFVLGLCIGVIVTAALYNFIEFKDLNEVETQCIAEFNTIQNIEWYENNSIRNVRNVHKSMTSDIVIPIHQTLKIDFKCAYGIVFEDVILF